MAVNLPLPKADELTPVNGVRLGFAMAGIKKPGRKDVLVIELCDGTSAAGVFTKNRFCAAPVQLCKEHLAKGKPIRACVINTGNANAGTGDKGLADALETANTLATQLQVDADQILVFSTGVILENLPMHKLLPAVKMAAGELGNADWLDAAQAIMTTDTQPKAYSAKHSVAGEEMVITGVSKGAGMIRPNMATMLGFLATDVDIAQPILNDWVKRLADSSFNRITIDGDTSTNDSFVVFATGQGNLSVQTGKEPHSEAVFNALKQASIELAQAIVRDGEGATKFISVVVEQAASSEEALKVAYAIAHSPLVKTAFYASDPNLGRILAAVGYAGIEDLDQRLIELYLGDVHVASRGGRLATYEEEQGQRVMNESEIVIKVKLGRGDKSETVWTTDLSHDYVSINADYRS